MDEEARKLAVALLDSEQTHYSTVFNVKNKQGDTTDDDKVVVFVIRTSGAGARRLLGSDVVIKAAIGPAGQVCPVCRGTGRL